MILEGASISTDSTFINLSHGREVVDHITFDFHSLPQNSFSVDILENVDNCIENGEHEATAVVFVYIFQYIN